MCQGILPCLPSSLVCIQGVQESSLKFPPRSVVLWKQVVMGCVASENRDVVKRMVHILFFLHGVAAPAIIKEFPITKRPSACSWIDWHWCGSCWHGMIGILLCGTLPNEFRTVGKLAPLARIVDVFIVRFTKGNIDIRSNPFIWRNRRGPARWTPRKWSKVRHVG
jgi:hypothetical protein